MSKVKIVARIRPFLPTETSDDAVTTEGDAISLRDFRNLAQRLIYKEFAACYNYTTAQEPMDLFNTEIEPLLGGVYHGKTIAILCYGVTSSGKTTTMQGKGQDPGIVVRSIETILQGQSLPSGSANVDHQFSMQYFEIYCDECYDLLAQSGHSTKLSVREEKDGRVNIANLSSHQFSTIEEFRTLVKKATKARRTAATTSNRSSSRSHAILNVTIFQAPPRRLSHTHLPRMLGRIEFVDLAGSERNKSGAEIGPAPKTRMAESVSINKSLTALSRVITALNNGSAMIPYRDSALTRVLKDALGGKSITLLICNIAPGAKWLSHTRSTIEFATKAKSIKSNPKPLGDEESKRRAEQKRHVDAEFNLAVEAEVTRRLAALTHVISPRPTEAPDVQNIVSEKPPPQEPLVPPVPPPVEEPFTMPVPSSDPEELQQTPDPEVPNQEYQGDNNNYVPPSFDEPPEAPYFVDDSPVCELENELVTKVREEHETLAPAKMSRLKEKSLPKRHIAEDSDPLAAKPMSGGRRFRAREREVDGAKERYRRKLTKGLKQKREQYRSSDQPIDRYKFARACIIAGKMALEEHDDVELAISMFEKAISWYPENERLLEETLKLKRRLRGGPDNVPSFAGQQSLSSTKTQSKLASTSKPLASTRNRNSSEDRSRGLKIFQFDVDKEEAVYNRQKATTEEAVQRKGKDAKIKPHEGESQLTGVTSKKEGKGTGKGKGRTVIEAAAAAFADSDVQEDVPVDPASQGSGAEVEKSLQADYLDDVPSPSPVKMKSKRKGRKGKLTDSDDEGYRHRHRDEQQEPKESPPKRRRIVF